MKKQSIISSIFSILLIIIIMIGTSGALIIEHSCGSCGLTEYHTDFFETEFHDECDCDTEDSSYYTDNAEAKEHECCTFTFEKLSLTDYNNPTRVNHITITPALFNSVPEVPAGRQLIPLPILTNHNKHGGRDILRSTCSLII